MPEATAHRSRRGPARAETVEAVHDDLDSLWDEADFVPEADRMAFTLAVVEAATNVVEHAVPATEAPLELEVNMTAAPHRLQAKIYEIGAAPVVLDFAATPAVEELAERGRGMALIQTLVSTVVFERHGDTNVWELRRDYHRNQP
ncbi:ATP-binding protein [Kocuria sp. CPCC 205263]|uniref:ATP-binding protein n=1 Tax=Kocuria sp. CPCC 205263 TaxID=3073555 RepID=UPI0034D50312